MRKGSTPHEQKLDEFLKKLEEKGHRVLNLQAKSPTALAIKNNKIYAVVLIKRIAYEYANKYLKSKFGKYGFKKSNSYHMPVLKKKYHMFDGVLECNFDIYTSQDFSKKQSILENFLKNLNDQGYRTIILSRRSPDGIAIKDDMIFAVEILGKQKYERMYNPKTDHGRFAWRYIGGSTLKQKKEYYDMFDDILFDFWYQYPEHIQYNLDLIGKGNIRKFQDNI